MTEGPKTLIDVAKAWAATPEGAAIIAERRANPKPIGPPTPPWSHERTVWLASDRVHVVRAP